MKKTLFLSLCAIVLLGFGCQGDGSQSSSDEPVVIDRDAILLQAVDNGLIMDSSEIDQMAASGQLETQASVSVDPNVSINGWKSAALADVTAGESYGLAFTTFEDGSFKLIAKLGNLPVPSNNYFYEGWLVRRGEDMSVVSTGVALLSGSDYINTFSATSDISDHDFYVLTLEPDDGDPAPAEHILEGIIK
jgi:hypothetical protein